MNRWIFFLLFKFRVRIRYSCPFPLNSIVKLLTLSSSEDFGDPDWWEAGMCVGLSL